MVKLENMCNNLMSNPLVCVVIALFVLLIILGMIRIISPGFSMGAQVKGHLGSLNGQINLEGFTNPNCDSCRRCNDPKCFEKYNCSLCDDEMMRG